MRAIRGAWSGDDRRMRGESQAGQNAIRKNAEIVTERVNLGDLGKKTNRKRPIQDRMSSAEGTEERVDDKGDSGTYCTCEGNP